MGKVATLKTKENESSVIDFINGVENEQMRNDSLVLLKLMQKVTKEEPKMWGSSMIGFGNKRFVSPATGREVDWFKIGFSPRKANLSLHLISNMNAHSDLLAKLGKHKTSVGCLYINKLEQVDVKVLEQLIVVSFQEK